MAKLSASGLSASRTRQARLREVLAIAVHDARILRNPVDGVKPPKLRSAERRYRTVEQVEESILAVESQAPGSGLVVDVLGWVGLRWGELVALRAARVNVEDRRIAVTEAAIEVAGKLVWGSPKTHEMQTVTVPASIHRRSERSPLACWQDRARCLPGRRLSSRHPAMRPRGGEKA